MLLIIIHIIVAFTVLCACVETDIVSVLGQRTSVSNFTSFLGEVPDLVDQLNAGTFTVLAPSNNAVKQFLANNSDIATDRKAFQALMRYHVIKGTHRVANFTKTPLFPATLLTDEAYTNVTGGQRVELLSLENVPTVLSGLKAKSQIAEPDISFEGGLIHVVDAVLTIPLPFTETINEAGLDELHELLDKGGWLSATSPATEILNDLSDITIFGPNDPRFSASFKGWDGLSQEEMNAILKYSVIPGNVLYSPEFKNASQFPTLLKTPITITETEGDIFVDASKITSRDYLIANGVLQVMDAPLSPDTSELRPQSNPSPTTSNSSGGALGGSKGLDAAAGAGIGVAIGAILGVIYVAFSFHRRKLQRQQALLDLENAAMVRRSTTRRSNARRQPSRREMAQRQFSQRVPPTSRQADLLHEQPLRSNPTQRQSLHVQTTIPPREDRPRRNSAPSPPPDWSP